MREREMRACCASEESHGIYAPDHDDGENYDDAIESVKGGCLLGGSHLKVHGHRAYGLDGSSQLQWGTPLLNDGLLDS